MHPIAIILVAIAAAAVVIQMNLKPAQSETTGPDIEYQYKIDEAWE